MLQDPDIPEAREVLASALKEMGDYSRAMECLDRAIILDQTSEASWFDRSLMHGRLDEHRQALKCFKRVSMMRPDFIRNVCPEVVIYDTVLNRNR